jgi:positive regulator of sigma E activity
MHADARTAARDSDCRLTADAVVVASRPDGTVDLEFAPHRGCQGCRGTCLWKRLAAMRLNRLSVDRPFAPGSAVSVTIPAEPVLFGALATYGIPLASILAGAAAGAALSGSDLGSLIGVVAALLLVIASFRLFRPRLERAVLASLRVLPRPAPREQPAVAGVKPGA